MQGVLRTLAFVVLTPALAFSGLGCGTQPTSTNSAPKPLGPGLYVGNLDCIESVYSTEEGSDSAPDFRNLTLGVGPSGLPKLGSEEVHVGMQRSGDILGITGVATATEVEAYEDGVTVNWEGNLYSGSDWCTLEVSESYKRAGEGGVEHSYTLSMFCDTGSGFLSYSEVCEGTLRR